MNSRRSRRSRLPDRRLRRESDGSLFDLDERRRIELGELCDDVRAGRHFRAARGSSGEDCTHEVLGEVLAEGIPRSLLPKIGTGGVESVVTGLFGGLLRAAGPARERIDDWEEDRDRPALRPRNPKRHDWWERGTEGG